MNNLKRNKRVFYHCAMKEQNGRVVFEKPEKVKLNFQPIMSNGQVRSDGLMLEVGLNSRDTLIVYMRPSYGERFHNGDRCYVYVEPPKQYDKTCNTADYYVDGEPKKYLNEYTIHLKRMTGDEYGK